MSLRQTAAWAGSCGLADLSDVALLGRLQNSADWLSHLIGVALHRPLPAAAKGRAIRAVDGTVVRKTGGPKRGGHGLWRLHSAFDLASERFGFLELTDQRGGEQLDRAPVVPGEIRLADRAYLQADRIAPVLEAGADVIVRAGWRNATWLTPKGTPLDLVAALKSARKKGVFDCPIKLGRKNGDPIDGLRLVALRKPEEAAKRSREKALKDARKGGHKITPETLIAAEWLILVTSLEARAFPAQEIGALYRLRWRIELAFKRLKSLIGYRIPPGKDEQLARTFLLAHLLLAVLMEPLSAQWRDSFPSGAQKHPPPDVFVVRHQTHSCAVRSGNRPLPTLARHAPSRRQNTTASK